MMQHHEYTAARSGAAVLFGLLFVLFELLYWRRAGNHRSVSSTALCKRAHLVK
jgi:hypothetical protein